MRKLGVVLALAIAVIVVGVGNMQSVEAQTGLIYSTDFESLTIGYSPCTGNYDVPIGWSFNYCALSNGYWYGPRVVTSGGGRTSTMIDTYGAGNQGSGLQLNAISYPQSNVYIRFSARCKSDNWTCQATITNNTSDTITTVNIGTYSDGWQDIEIGPVYLNRLRLRHEPKWANVSRGSFWLDNLEVWGVPPPTATPMPTATPPATLTPPPTITPTPTPSLTPTPLPGACDLLWNFETEVPVEWWSLTNTWSSLGYNDTGSMRDSGAFGTNTLSKSEILTALGYPNDSEIVSDNVTFRGYALLSGGAAWSTAELAINYTSGDDSSDSSNSSALWQQLSVPAASSKFIASVEVRTTTLGSAYYDNLWLRIPCQNITSPDGTPYPTPTPTNTATPTPTGTWTSPTPTPTSSGPTPTPTSTPPPWASPSPTLTPPPTPTTIPPTAVPNPGGDPIPPTGGGPGVCYECPIPTGMDMLSLGQWISFLACVLRSLFNCGLYYWLKEVTNSVSGVFQVLWSYVIWLWSTFATLFTLLPNILDVWINSFINSLAQYGIFLTLWFLRILLYISNLSQMFSQWLRDTNTQILDYIGSLLMSLEIAIVTIPRQLLQYLLESNFVQTLWAAADWAGAVLSAVKLLIGAFITMMTNLYNALLGFVQMLRDTFIYVRDAFAAAPYTISIITEDGTETSSLQPEQLDQPGFNATKVLWLFLSAISSVDWIVGQFRLEIILLLVVGVLGIGLMFWTMKLWHDVIPV